MSGRRVSVASGQLDHALASRYSVGVDSVRRMELAMGMTMARMMIVGCIMHKVVRMRRER